MSAATLPRATRGLYPFDGYTQEIGKGIRLHYLDEGSGTPLLMLHGNPTWSFYYRDLVWALRDKYRCVVPDHIGCGLSDKPARWGYTISDHVDNVCALIERLELRDITLIVHDWGGTIGYLSALRLPERFSRFVVFNTAVSLLPLPRWLLLLRHRWIGSLGVRGLNLMIRGGLFSARRRSNRFPEAVRRGYLAPYDSWKSRIAIQRFIEAIPVEAEHPNRRLMAELSGRMDLFRQRPHLVVWGLQDPVFNRGYFDAWRALVPEAEFHAFDDVGHWVVEEAADRVVPLVRGFLERSV